jgi:ABC-type uncharacterized transport system ATPase subunit
MPEHCMVWVVGDDFAVPGGGVFGFLGPNGAGKTTTRWGCASGWAWPPLC